jgi:hypothetical protein
MAVVLLIAITWTASLWCAFGRFFSSQRVVVCVWAGRLEWWPADLRLPSGWHAEPRRFHVEWALEIDLPVKSVPLWMMIIPPLGVAVSLWIAARGRELGLCRSCFYDRQGLAADAKCPECGTVPPLPCK